MPSVSQAKLIGKAGLPFNSMVTRRALDTKEMDNGTKLQTLTGPGGTETLGRTEKLNRTEKLCGVIVLDKPSGWTSHDAVNKLRRIAGTKILLAPGIGDAVVDRVNAGESGS